MEVDLAHKNKEFAFLIGIAFFLAAPILFPAMRLYFLAPPIIITIYHESRVKCLWIALLSGLLADLVDSHHVLGLNSLSYAGAAWILHGQRKHFFADSLSTMPVMTFLFSVLISIEQILLLYMLDGRISLSLAWVSSDLIALPLLDALYAFGAFILPALFFGRPRRKGSDYFLSR